MTNWTDPLGEGADAVPPPRYPAPTVRRRGTRGRPAGVVRALEAVAGVLGAGVLVVGLVLLLAQIVAPRIWPGPGLGAAAGPGWGRVALHLVVGAAAEIIRGTRRSSGGTVRGLLAGAMVLAVIVVCWVAWWN